MGIFFYTIFYHSRKKNTAATSASRTKLLVTYFPANIKHFHIGFFLFFKGIYQKFWKSLEYNDTLLPLTSHAGRGQGWWYEQTLHKFNKSFHQISYNTAHKASHKKLCNIASTGKEQVIQRATDNFAIFKAVLDVEQGFFFFLRKSNSALQRENILTFNFNKFLQEAFR